MIHYTDQAWDQNLFTAAHNAAKLAKISTSLLAS
jgi:hypothetical protein